MTFNELLEVTKDIDLEALGVSLGKAANKCDMISCFVDGDEWVMQEVDDRQHVFEKRGKEEDILERYTEILNLEFDSKNNNTIPIF